MLLRYIYDQNLAQASYFVGCQQTGEAIIVDPARDIEPYIELAAAEEMRIAAAVETHIHADFVSGSRELASRVGAKLYLSDCGSENWKYAFTGTYDQQLLRDGDIFWVGNLRFESIHTPGHTPEHITLLLTDTVSADQPMGLFSGDFVFVGDIGRPDLLETAAQIQGSAEIGARQMYSSLKWFSGLPDYLQVWPGHGAGSACGRDLGAVPTSTVGYEKKFNWAFAVSDENQFVERLLADQPETPKYFGEMKRVNKEGPALLKELPEISRAPFNRLAEVLADGLTVVDTRRADEFATAHIPGTINIPPESSFSNWAGWLVNYSQPFFLIVDDRNVAFTASNLRAVGLDNCAGYFDLTCFDSWTASGKKLSGYEQRDAGWLAQELQDGEVVLVDVRSQSEWNEEQIPGAKHIMLGYLGDRIAELPANKAIVVQCRTGVRSSIGASILKASGFDCVINLKGGIEAWKAARMPAENA